MTRELCDPANRAELLPHFIESGAHGRRGLVQHIENYSYEIQTPLSIGIQEK